MTEIDALVQRIARLEAAFAQIDALLLELRARRQQDVPLHQRGFGVMDEPAG